MSQICILADEIDVLNVFITFIYSMSQHGVGFPTSRLAVGKQGRVVSFPRIVKNFKTQIVENNLLKTNN